MSVIKPRYKVHNLQIKEFIYILSRIIFSIVGGRLLFASNIDLAKVIILNIIYKINVLEYIYKPPQILNTQVFYLAIL